jgi:hypothetical protein
LFEYGFGYAWIAQEIIGSHTNFMALLVDRVNDRAPLNILSQEENSPKANFYKHFKSDKKYCGHNALDDVESARIIYFFKHNQIMK